MTRHFRTNNIAVRLLCIALLLAGGLPTEAQSARDAAYHYECALEAARAEDWHAAVDGLLECLKLDAARSDAALLLAECYYSLGQYAEALLWARKSVFLDRGSVKAANLEAAALLALDRADEAVSALAFVRERAPHDIDGLFLSAYLACALGRTEEAAQTFREALGLYPDDLRLLTAAALVRGSLGDADVALDYIAHAVRLAPGDWCVRYHAAYLHSRAGRLEEAIAEAEHALRLRPSSEAALYLLASLRYRAGGYAEAIALADRLIDSDSDIGTDTDTDTDTGPGVKSAARLLMALSLKATGRSRDALAVLEEAAGLDGTDEFVRAALEDVLLDMTSLEDPRRRPWADYHFERAEGYQKNASFREALFEYRRGLRVNPYAAERLGYAAVLRLAGYPHLYLEELRFMRELRRDMEADEGLRQMSGAPYLWGRMLDDYAETYEAILSGSLADKWEVEPAERRRRWNVAVFAPSAQASLLHPDAARIAALYVTDILSHDNNINAVFTSADTFAAAFRAANNGDAAGMKADYFLAVGVLESGADIAVNAALYSARTGAQAASFGVYRAGAERLRRAARNIAEQLDAALPFRAALLRRASGEGLIDKGGYDGVKPGASYLIIKKGRAQPQSDAPGLRYAAGDVAGEFIVSRTDDTLAAGALKRRGFFDRIEEGDEVIAKDEPRQPVSAPAIPPAADPELRTMLGRLAAPLPMSN
jgi:tetratricopeptide (TPR) repeat protein